MGALANIELTATFNTWRIRTNQALTRLNAYTLNESVLFANTFYANVAFIAKSGANTNFLGTGTHLNLKTTKLANTVSLIGAARLLAGHETTTGSNVHDVVNKNTAMFRWLRNSGTTASNFGLAANTGLGTNSDSIRQIVPTANGEMHLFWAGAARLGGWFKFESNGMGLMVSGVSTADHGAPAVDRAVLYTKKSPGGGTDPTFKVRFNTGLAKVFAAPFSAIDLPTGNNAQRPSPVANGAIRYNTQLTKFEGYKAGGWSTVGGGATGGGVDEIFIENGMTVTEDYTLTTGKNAMSTGPITINPGKTVTIPSGARWVIL